MVGLYFSGLRYPLSQCLSCSLVSVLCKFVPNCWSAHAEWQPNRVDCVHEQIILDKQMIKNATAYGMIQNTT